MFVSMVSMLTSAIRLQGLLILPNKHCTGHCTYKNDLVLVTKPFYNCVKALFASFIDIMILLYAMYFYNQFHIVTSYIR